MQAGRAYLIEEKLNQCHIDLLSKNKTVVCARLPFQAESTIILTKNLTYLKDQITKHIPKKRTIFLEGIDYIVKENSFEETLEVLFEIHDLVMKSKSTLIIFQEKSLLSLDEQNALHQEFHLWNLSDHLEPELEECYNIIKKNKGIRTVDLAKLLSISQTTLRKRLKILSERNLIVVQENGREKRIVAKEK